MVILTILAAGVGAYFGSYLKQKAITRANEEDRELLHRQAEELTRVTKQAESSISQRDWQNQRTYELKRDAVLNSIGAMVIAQVAIEDYYRHRRSDHHAADNSDQHDQKSEELEQKCREVLSDFAQSGSRLYLLCSDKTYSHFFSAHGLLKILLVELSFNGPETYQHNLILCNRKNADFYSSCRAELGLEPIKEQPPSPIRDVQET